MMMMMIISDIVLLTLYTLCCHMGIVISKHPVPDWVKPAAICNFWHPGTLTLMAEHQSGRMSKITNDALTCLTQDAL